MSERFWLVWCGTDGTAIPYPTLEEAQFQAERMALENLGRAYHVLERIRTVLEEPET